MFFKKDIQPNTNYGYTFNSSWNYRPKIDSNIEPPKNNYYNKQIDKKPSQIKRGGIIFLNKSNNFNDSKFLVVRGKESGIWSFPKGRIDDNEDEEICAIREVYEETGIKISSLKDKERIRIGRNTYFIFYVSDINEYNEFNITDTYEVDVVEWKSFSDLKNMTCNKDIRSITTYPQKQFNYHNLLF